MGVKNYCVGDSLFPHEWRDLPPGTTIGFDPGRLDPGRLDRELDLTKQPCGLWQMSKTKQMYEDSEFILSRCILSLPIGGDDDDDGQDFDWE